MLEDFLSYLFYAGFTLVSILIAHVAVEMKGYSAWETYFGTLAGTCLIFGFVCDAVEVPYDQHWGKLLAYTTVQSLAFLWFRATSSRATSGS